MFIRVYFSETSNKRHMNEMVKLWVQQGQSSRSHDASVKFGADMIGYWPVGQLGLVVGYYYYYYYSVTLSYQLP